jgi:hypothetical protein
MYVEISAVYCKNHAEKQVKCVGRVMNILMLYQLVFIQIPSGFKGLRRKTGIWLYIIYMFISVNLMPELLARFLYFAFPRIFYNNK